MLANTRSIRKRDTSTFQPTQAVGTTWRTTDYPHQVLLRIQIAKEKTKKCSFGWKYTGNCVCAHELWAGFRRATRLLLLMNSLKQLSSIEAGLASRAHFVSISFPKLFVQCRFSPWKIPLFQRHCSSNFFWLSFFCSAQSSDASWLETKSCRFVGATCRLPIGNAHIFD